MLTVGQAPLRFITRLRWLSGRPRGRDSRPPAPSRSTASVDSRSPAAHVLGPGSLGLSPSSLERLEAHPGSGRAGDRDRLAPPRVPSLLAPELSRGPPYPWLAPCPRPIRSKASDRPPALKNKP